MNKLQSGNKCKPDGRRGSKSDGKLCNGRKVSGRQWWLVGPTVAREWRGDCWGGGEVVLCVVCS
jgi:hypothetical protein